MEGKLHTIEWTIENFSFCVFVPHDPCISTPRLDKAVFYRKLDLYPRGLTGEGENLVVRISGDVNSFSGDLSFIGPDGSLFHTQKISQGRGSVLVLPPGPSYKTVVSLIRKGKGKDQLTLRCRLKSTYNIAYHFNTTFNAFNVPMRIPAKIIEAIQFQNEIFVINYPLDDDGNVSGISLYVSKYVLTEEDAVIKCELSPHSASEFLCVYCRLSVLNRDEDLVRSEEAMLQFFSNKKLTFSETVSFKQLLGEECSLLFQFKVLSCNSYKSYGYYCFNSTFNPRDLEINSLSSLEGNISEKRNALATPKSLCATASEQAEDEMTILSQELMCLYQDQDFSDFEILCGNISFHTHKNILSARSPVFKTMLKAGMKETASGSMKVEDLDASTFTRFLTFLYSGTVEDLQCDSAIKLYYAADKYQVPSLKKVCTSVMLASLSISNVCGILSLADHHQDEELTRVAREFILDNYNQVLKSEEWKSFMTTDPIVLLKTVTYLAEQDHVGKKTINRPGQCPEAPENPQIMVSKLVPNLL